MDDATIGVLLAKYVNSSSSAAAMGCLMPGEGSRQRGGDSGVGRVALRLHARDGDELVHQSSTRGWRGVE